VVDTWTRSGSSPPPALRLSRQGMLWTKQVEVLPGDLSHGH